VPIFEEIGEKVKPLEKAADFYKEFCDDENEEL
jgi:hypothetical protein